MIQQYKKINLLLLLSVFSTKGYGVNEKEAAQKLYFAYQKNLCSKEFIEKKDYSDIAQVHDLNILREMIEIKKKTQSTPALLVSSLRTLANNLKLPSLKQQLMIDCARISAENNMLLHWMMPYIGKKDVLTGWDSPEISSIFDQPQSSQIDRKHEASPDQKSASQKHSILNGLDIGYLQAQLYQVNGSIMALGLEESAKPYDFSNCTHSPEGLIEVANYFKTCYEKSLPNKLFHTFYQVSYWNLPSEVAEWLAPILQNDEAVFSLLTKYRADVLQNPENRDKSAEMLIKMEAEKLILPGLKQFFLQEVEYFSSLTLQQRKYENAKMDSEVVFEALFDMASSKAKEKYNAFYQKSKYNPKIKSQLENAKKVFEQFTALNFCTEEDNDIFIRVDSLKPTAQDFGTLLKRLATLKSMESSLHPVEHPDFKSVLMSRIRFLSDRYNYFFKEANKILSRYDFDKEKYPFYSEWSRSSGAEWHAGKSLGDSEIKAAALESLPNQNSIQPANNSPAQSLNKAEKSDKKPHVPEKYNIFLADDESLSPGKNNLESPLYSKKKLFLDDDSDSSHKESPLFLNDDAYARKKIDEFKASVCDYSPEQKLKKIEQIIEKLDQEKDPKCKKTLLNVFTEERSLILEELSQRKAFFHQNSSPFYPQKTVQLEQDADEVCLKQEENLEKAMLSFFHGTTPKEDVLRLATQKCKKDVEKTLASLQKIADRMQQIFDIQDEYKKQDILDNLFIESTNISPHSVKYAIWTSILEAQANWLSIWGNQPASLGPKKVALDNIGSENLDQWISQVDSILDPVLDLKNEENLEKQCSKDEKNPSQKKKAKTKGLTTLVDLVVTALERSESFENSEEFIENLSCLTDAETDRFFYDRNIIGEIEEIHDRETQLYNAFRQPNPHKISTADLAAEISQLCRQVLAKAKTMHFEKMRIYVVSCAMDSERKIKEIMHKK
jgi:hypothetical protein